MKVYILWVYMLEGEIYQPVIWSIHKTKAGAGKEMNKHEEGFIITYDIKD